MTATTDTTTAGHVPSASTTPAPVDPGPGRAAGLTARLGMSAFALTALVAGLLEPGYDPLRETISTLAAKDAAHPQVVVAAFLAAAVALLAAGLALTRRLRGRAGTAGGVLVSLAAVGMAVCGLAQSDCSQTDAACLAAEQAGTVSASHWVHQLVSLALFVTLLVALPLLARGLRRTPSLAHLARTGRRVALLAVVLLVVLVSQTPDGLAGAAQRAFLLVVFGWPVVLTVLSGARPAARRADVRA